MLGALYTVQCNITVCGITDSDNLMSTRSNMDASERRTKLRLTGECEGLQCGGPVFKREAIVQIHVV